MKRRRFLQIATMAALSGRAARAETWRGQAFGAEISVTLPGAAPLSAIRDEISQIEATFSLYRPSELTRLNGSGRGPGSPMMRAVLEHALRVHQATAGACDPTVQPLWQALAEGGDVERAQRKIGFDRIVISNEIRLGAGQALTLNGIVQGYAADRIAALLETFGYGDCLVDMGEFVAFGGGYTLGICDPQAGRLGQRHIGAGADRALATSSPGALTLPGGSHILGPRGEAPRWSTVTVGAPSAALADAASTAFVLMEHEAIAQARDRLGLGAVSLVDFSGNLTTI